MDRTGHFDPPTGLSHVHLSRFLYRYVFFAVICAKLVDEPLPRARHALAEPVPNSYERFSPTSTGGFHTSITGQRFKKWFQKFLKTFGKERHVVIIVNATFHTFRLNEYANALEPSPERLQAFIRMLTIAYDPGLKITNLRKHLREYVRISVSIEIVHTTEQRSHEVLFIPPSWSEFQPIERIWALANLEIGKLYSDTTTFIQVTQRLDAAFANLEQKQVTIGKVITHIENKWIFPYYNYHRQHGHLGLPEEKEAEAKDAPRESQERLPGIAQVPPEEAFFDELDEPDEDGFRDISDDEEDEEEEESLEEESSDDDSDEDED